MSFDAMRCYVKSCQVVMLCHVMSCHVIRCDAILCHVMSWDVMWYVYYSFEYFVLITVVSTALYLSFLQLKIKTTFDCESITLLCWTRTIFPDDQWKLPKTSFKLIWDDTTVLASVADDKDDVGNVDHNNDNDDGTAAGNDMVINTTADADNDTTNHDGDAADDDDVDVNVTLCQC